MSARNCAMQDISLDEDSGPILITKEKIIVDFLNEDENEEED